MRKMVCKYAQPLTFGTKHAHTCHILRKALVVVMSDKYQKLCCLLLVVPRHPVRLTYESVTCDGFWIKCTTFAD